MCVASSRPLYLVLFYLVATQVVVSQETATEDLSAESAEQSETETQKTRVVYLSTEFFPLAEQEDSLLESRMLREIARQTVLLVARDELGMPTRDETLGEPPTTGDAESDFHLAVVLRVFPSGHYELKLNRVDPLHSDKAPDELWTHKARLPDKVQKMYVALADQLTKQVPQIAAAMREAGATGKPDAFNTSAELSEEVDALLDEMNFVSQYAAIRLAHRSISNDGPSLPALAALVRGYAHLSALTTHWWTSHSEAFAARSMLYAARLNQYEEAPPTSDWLRAYSLSITGMHGVALDLLEEISAEDNVDPNSAEQQPGSPESRPDWTPLIEAYANCSLKEIDSFKENNEDKYLELTAFLRWSIYDAYRHGRWIYEKGLEASQTCPEAYSIYSTMARWSALRVKRVGASMALQAFPTHLPRRVLSIDDLPKSVQLAASEDGFFAQLFENNSEQSDRTLIPSQMSKALLNYTKQTDSPNEPSWALLGGMIAEEQFVQVANYMKVAQDGVESGNSALIDRVRPMVEGHRYLNLILSYDLPRRAEKSELEEVLDGMKILDPRGNMYSMFIKLWRYRATPDSKDGRHLSYSMMFHPTLTLAGINEAAYPSSDYWSPYTDKSKLRDIAAYCREASPKSPNAMVLTRNRAEKVELEDLIKWEAETGDDPVAWLALGWMYYERWETDAGARCYKKSLEISPCYAATEGLANCYLWGGKEELYTPTLETYLEFEDLGLAHGKIHKTIADYHIKKLNWEEALPHAEESAQTWSAWGLQLAAKVNEGLQDWERSEYWVSEASRNYPSTSAGIQWYFWCKRTGRGHLGSALEVAERWTTLPSSSERDKYYLATYYILEDNPGEALGIMQQLERECNTTKNRYDKAWYLAHLAMLARKTNQPEMESQSIANLRQVANGPIKQKKEELVPAIIAFCDLLDKQEVSTEHLTSIFKTLGELEAWHRCNYGYFIGLALEENDRIAEADRFLLESAEKGPYEYVNATLAGHRLAERYGPERRHLMQKTSRAGKVQSLKKRKAHRKRSARLLDKRFSLPKKWQPVGKTSSSGHQRYSLNTTSCQRAGVPLSWLILGSVRKPTSLEAPLPRHCGRLRSVGPRVPQWSILLARRCKRRLQQMQSPASSCGRRPDPQPSCAG